MTKALCLLAFETLNNRLVSETTSTSLASFNSLTNGSSDDYPDSAPLFITWNKHGDLRGCIGTFRALPIESGVKKFALTSALEDSRFPPISRSELPALSVSVTLLDKFTPISLPLDWEIGLHGLKLYISYHGRSYSGTFLPSVAEEQEWDKKTTLWYLLRKAEFESVSKSKLVEFYEKGLAEGWLELERYDGVKSELDYDAHSKLKEELLGKA